MSKVQRPKGISCYQRLSLVENGWLRTTSGPRLGKLVQHFLCYKIKLSLLASKRPSKIDNGLWQLLQPKILLYIRNMLVSTYTSLDKIAVWFNKSSNFHVSC